MADHAHDPDPGRRAGARRRRAPGRIPASGEYVRPGGLGAGKVTLVGGLLADEIQNNGNYPLGSALTVGLIVLMLLMLVTAWIVQRIWSRPRRRAPAAAPEASPTS